MRIPASGELTGRALWRMRVAETPERTFLSFGGRDWSYREFDAGVRGLAAGLAGRGVGRGDRVLVAMGNRPMTLQLELAIQELGAVFVPLLPGLTFGELAYPINHSEARVLAMDASAAPVLLANLSGCPGVELLLIAEDVEAPAGRPAARLSDLAACEPLPAGRQLTGHGADALAAILYTSGSTGRPKGVMLRAGSFWSVGDAFADRFGVGGDDTYFLPTTLAHAVGCLTALSMTLHSGGRLALVDRFSPSSFWDEVEQAGGTYSILFPAHLNLLLEADDGSPGAGESTLRLLITHAYISRFRERFGVELATVWGMTETGALCVGSEPGYRGELGENYVGTPMKGVQVAVLDDRLAPVPPDVPGEICLRHQHVMLGYLKDPDATAQALVDGWVRSGDLGTLDEAGRLFFVGRIKNVIKRSGENVSAEEVEGALSAHPDVAECTVFAVPDPIRTEEVAAAVVRRPGARADPVELRAACSERLVRWKLPRYIVLRDEPLPRLPNGKLDRVALRDSLDLARAFDANRG